MKNKSDNYRDDFSIPCYVKTKDGFGTIVSRKLIRGSNDGPGSHRFIVKLDDGRLRTYGRGQVEKNDNK